MTKFNLIKPFFLLSVALIFLSSCEALKYRPVSAKDYPPDPKERVRKNIEEGRGIRLFDGDKKKVVLLTLQAQILFGEQV